MLEQPTPEEMDMSTNEITIGKESAYLNGRMVGQWNYPHRAFVDRAEAISWIQKHADEVAEIFPLRFGIA